MFDDESAVLGDPLSMPDGVWENAVDEALSRPADPYLSDLIPDLDAFGVADLDPYSGWDDSLDAEVGEDLPEDDSWGEEHDLTHDQVDDPATESHDSVIGDTALNGHLDEPTGSDAAGSAGIDGSGLDDASLETDHAAPDGLIDDGGLGDHGIPGDLAWAEGSQDDWSGGEPDASWPCE